MFAKMPRPLWALIGLVLVAGVVYMQKPKGLRNYNPLNIRFNPSVEWLGQIGKDKDGFVVFKTVRHGFRAAGRLLRTYRDKYDLVTIAQIVARWAPPSENDTQNYINVVEQITGIDKDKVLERADYPHVVAAMVRMENGAQPFAMAQIVEGVEWGLYG